MHYLATIFLLLARLVWFMTYPNLKKKTEFGVALVAPTWDVRVTGEAKMTQKKKKKSASVGSWIHSNLLKRPYIEKRR